MILFYRKIAGIRLNQVSGSRQVEVPFRLGDDRRPYVTIKVNGREANFVVDTGSGFTVISEEAARKLGIGEVARGGTSQGVGGNGKFLMVYGLINSVAVGDAKLEYVPCFIRPFLGSKELAPRDRADGFIGLSVLSSFLTELDYKAQVLRLYRNQEATAPPPVPAPDATVIPFRMTQNGLISVETQLDRTHQVNVILDSGASSTVISTAAVKRLDMNDEIIKGETVQVIGAAGITDDVEMLLLKNCQVANLEQNNLRALILDFGAINETSGFEQSGILGGDFLRHFRVKIDFPRARVFLEPQTAEVIKREESKPPHQDSY